MNDSDKRFTANGEAAFLVSVAMQRSDELTTKPSATLERIEDDGPRARVFVPELASYPDAVRKRIQDTVNSYVYRHLRIEIEAKEAPEKVVVTVHKNRSVRQNQKPLVFDARLALDDGKEKIT
jgi:hypothetical protein